MIGDDRAQLYTMEGVASAMLMIVVVIFILKAAPLTPNSASASHMQIEKELELLGQDLLTVLDYTPSDSEYSQLKQGILGWTGSQFDGQSAVMPLGGPTNVTAGIFREMLGDFGIAYNVELFYNTFSGSQSKAILWNGKPSDNAVLVSRKILLHDEEMDSHPILRDEVLHDDLGTGTEFYNIVEVRVTLWRM